MMAKTISGLELGGAATDQPGHGYPNIYPGQTYHVQIEFTCLLNPGTYFMNTGIMGIVDENLTYLARKIDVLMFRVRPVEKIKATGWVNFEVMPTAKRIA